MADIFLSYSRDDIDRVRPLVTALERDGFSVWWDSDISPGQKFEETIDREIQSASCVLVVWSLTSVASQWVKNEALEGMDREVLVPIIIDSVRLPVAFKQHQVCDFTGWPASIDNDQYRQLVDAIFGLVHSEVRGSAPIKGIDDMAPRGRRRYRRNRDRVVSLLIGAVLLLLTALIFNFQQSNDTALETRLTINRFESGDGEQASFYADSITRELRVNFAGVEDLELVQVGSLWDLDLVDVPDVVIKTQADYILGGAVDAVGDEIKLKAFLKDVHSGRIIWEAAITDNTSNLIDVQQIILRGVLGKLKMVSSALALTTSIVPMTRNKSAYRDYLIGKDLLRSGDDQNLRDAIGRFETAYEKDHGFILAIASGCRAYIELFRATKAAEDFASGKELCEQVLASDQSSAETRLALAELYLTSGKIESAKLEYLEVLELSPGDPDASIGLASVLVQEGELQAGEELYLRSAREHPTYWKAHSSLGTYYFRQGMYHRAMENYTRVTELMASNAIAFSNLGAARLYAGNFEDASVAWRRANQLDSNSASLSNLGTALYHSGNFEEALEQYKAAIVIDPSDHRLWGNLGDNLRLISGRETEAIVAYNKAVMLAEAVIEVNHDDAYTLSRLAVYYAAISRVTTANEMIKRAEFLAELDLNVMYDLAVASILLGNRKEAQEYITRALSYGYPEVLIQSDPQLIGTKVLNNEK